MLLPNPFNRGVIVFGLVLVWWMAAAPQSGAQTNQAVYSDALQNGWANWSWATVNVANSSPVRTGAASISVSSTNWQALYLHHSAQSGAAATRSPSCRTVPMYARAARQSASRGTRA